MSLQHDRAWDETSTFMSAVAISGAAVSPGMGRQTNRWYQALLALANFRLGVWVPNPMAPQNGVQRRPRTGIRFSKELPRLAQHSRSIPGTSPMAGIGTTSALSKHCDGVPRRSSASTPATRWFLHISG